MYVGSVVRVFGDVVAIVDSSIPRFDGKITTSGWKLGFVLSSQGPAFLLGHLRDSGFLGLILGTWGSSSSGGFAM